MMKMQSRKIWYYRITLIILLFAMLLAWALLPGVHEFINRSVAAFAAVRSKIRERYVPKAWRGLPIYLLTAAILSMALLAF